MVVYVEDCFLRRYIYSGIVVGWRRLCSDAGTVLYDDRKRASGGGTGAGAYAGSSNSCRLRLLPPAGGSARVLQVSAYCLC